MNLDGEYFAPELIEEQTIENLSKFSDKLEMAYQFLKRKSDVFQGKT